MLGAIIGDIIGSNYEFDNVKTTNFTLIDQRSNYTDDSLMTIAVAMWLMTHTKHYPETLVKIMQYIGRKYPLPKGGYGGRFSRWLESTNPQPYNSWGNGSAMRVSPVGMYAQTLAEARQLARITAEVTHNHPEGIKGAEATASCVFLAKEGKSKSFIKSYVMRHFGYNLNRTIDEIRPTYKFDESCQGTVSEAIIAFLEGKNFEDVIRLAVSIGGDSDTLACIAGGIAGAYYPIPQQIAEECRKKFANDSYLLKNIEIFEAQYAGGESFKQMVRDYEPAAFWNRSSNEARLISNVEACATLAEMATQDYSIAALANQHAIEYGQCNSVFNGQVFNSICAMWQTLLTALVDTNRQNERLAIECKIQQNQLIHFERYARHHDYGDWTFMGNVFNRLIRNLLNSNSTKSALEEFIKHNSRLKVASQNFRPTFTPEKISRLYADEVFVFGSDIHGIHAGGAARVAVERFGAIMHCGEGIQGQSYAIPTMSSLREIAPYVERFIEYAKEHPNKIYYVTRIGCGIAGYSDKEIAPMFAKAVMQRNILLPKSFWRELIMDPKILAILGRIQPHRASEIESALM